MLTGIGLCVVVFIFEYSRSQAAEADHVVKSNVLRDTATQAFLKTRDRSIVFIAIHGFVFFGSALRILRNVKSKVLVLNESGGLETLMQHHQPTLKFNDDSNSPARAKSSGVVVLRDLNPGSDNNMTGPGSCPTRFVVLDCAAMTGLDATAARSCFLELKQLLHEYGVTLIMCGMKRHIHQLLHANDVLPPLNVSTTTTASSTVDGGPLVFSTASVAKQFCESQILKAYSGPTSFTCAEILRSLLPKQPNYFNHEKQESVVDDDDDNNQDDESSLAVSDDSELETLASFMTLQDVNHKETIVNAGERANSVYFVRSGTFEMTKSVNDNFATDSDRLSGAGTATSSEASSSILTRRDNGSSIVDLQLNRKENDNNNNLGNDNHNNNINNDQGNIVVVQPGCVFGQTPFLMNSRYKFSCSCISESGGQVYVLTRSNFVKIQRQEPRLAVVLMTALVAGVVDDV